MCFNWYWTFHYCDVIMDAMASRITSLIIVYSTVYSVADQRKHQSSASLAFVRGIHRWPVNSPHKGPVTRERFHLMTSPYHGNPMGLWHDDMTSTRFPYYCPFVRVIYWWSVISLHKGPRYDAFFVVRLHTLLNKQPSCQWFETPWRHSCDVTLMMSIGGAECRTLHKICSRVYSALYWWGHIIRS